MKPRRKAIDMARKSNWPNPKAGDKIATLTIKRLTSPNARGQKRWLCECDCGEQSRRTLPQLNQARKKIADGKTIHGCAKCCHRNAIAARKAQPTCAHQPPSDIDGRHCEICGAILDWTTNDPPRPDCGCATTPEGEVIHWDWCKAVKGETRRTV